MQLRALVPLALVGVVTSAILRVVLERPRRGSVVWVVAVLTLAVSCPAFVGTPYRLSLQTQVHKDHQEHCADLADQFKTASVAGTVAFLMNCGGAGAGTADALAEAYPVAPGSHVEQQGSYARAPLSYQGVQQQLPMADFDADQARMSEVHPPPQVGADALRSDVVAWSSERADTPQPADRLAALEARVREEKLRLREAQAQLYGLEEDLQAARVRQDAAGLAGQAAQAAPEAASDRGGGFLNGLRDVLLVGFGGVLGAVGYAWGRFTDAPELHADVAQAQPAPTASTADAGGPVSLGGLAVAAEAPVGAAALGLAFTASVFTSAPSLSAAPVHLPSSSDLPLLTMTHHVPRAPSFDSEAT
ncbi:unnamed protein product [Durusdinium trenchii]|uniref:Uncharacterized protein n=1 Tax=Durusdinium trenchii TaxID=1381693 RepID=A0ABP0KE12_9DINO